MLAFARQNLHEHLQTGQARLVRADAASFSVEDRFGLATATFDSLNMLQSHAALKSCFECVRRSVLDEGMFVFDLMTRRGFWQDYNGVWAGDTEDELYVFKSVYDGGDKAATRMTGFVREGGRWARFEELRTPTLFHPPVVVEALQAAGWSRPWAANLDDLAAGGPAGKVTLAAAAHEGVLGLLGVAALPPDVIVEQTDEGPRYHVPDDWFLAIPAGGSGRG